MDSTFIDQKYTNKKCKSAQRISSILQIFKQILPTLIVCTLICLSLITKSQATENADKSKLNQEVKSEMEEAVDADESVNTIEEVEQDSSTTRAEEDVPVNEESDQPPVAEEVPTESEQLESAQKTVSELDGHSEENNSEENPTQEFSNKDYGLVEVVKYRNKFGNYRERRESTGTLISITLENYLPKNFISKIDGRDYATIFSQDIPFYSVDLAYKLNIYFASLTLGVGYGSGTNSSGKYTLSIDRSRAEVGLFLDGILPEPYLVPYGKYYYSKYVTRESNSTTQINQNNDLGFGSGMRVGALIQLNWIDEASSIEGRNHSGIENTYLDVFMAENTMINEKLNLDVSTETIYGAGLAIEF